MAKLNFLFVVAILISISDINSQNLDLNTVLQTAISHRQTQNAAHDILWGVGHTINDSWFVDQEKGEVTFERGTLIIKLKIKIIGTYDHKDSTFLWSIYNESIKQSLTSPVHRLADVSQKNNWNIVKRTPIKCSFEKAMELATLAFYVDSANGVKNRMTNSGRTNFIYTYYDVDITDRMFKVFNIKIPTKKQYDIIQEPSLIDFCKKYVITYYESEKRYYRLYERNNKDQKYMDTMLANRVRISDAYWDTTSLAYLYHRKNRLIPHDMNTVSNWRVVTIGDNTKYVLYDEKENWGFYKTWAFEICIIGNKYKIKNEFICF